MLTTIYVKYNFYLIKDGRCDELAIKNYTDLKMVSGHGQIIFLCLQYYFAILVCVTVFVSTCRFCILFNFLLKFHSLWFCFPSFVLLSFKMLKRKSVQN